MQSIATEEEGLAERTNRWLVVVPRLILLAAVIALAWWLASRYLAFADIKRVGLAAKDLSRDNPLIVALAVAGACAFGMAFSLPSKAILTLLAGALLGPVVGTIAGLVGVLAGTSALFVAVRRLLRDWANRKMGERARKLERRMSSKPVRSIAGLRMVLTLPYASITIAAALSTIRYRDFLLGSLIGDLPVIVLYTVAGERLQSLTSASEAISPLTMVILVVAGCALLIGPLLGGRGDR